MIQRDFIGFNSIGNIKSILSKHKPKKIFLVTGKSSYLKSGAKSIMDNLLKGYNIVHFYNFEENPKLSDIEKGIDIYKNENCDFVIAVGGGSVMDVAKSINILASNQYEPVKYIKYGEKLQSKGSVLVAVPTTAGSGSEATKFAVIYINKNKYSLDNNFMLPNYAILDPQFTLSLPKSITASTGMDALSQAIESYWCIHSTDESKIYAKEAIKLVMENLPIAVKNPSKESREAMVKAAHLAGKAINISRTTAPHAISYPITSNFNVPHGHAVALTLPSLLIYNLEVTEENLLDKRGINYVKKIINQIVNLLGAENVEDAAQKIKNLMETIGLKTKLSYLGIETDNDVKTIIQNGFNSDRVNNNPRKLTEEALRKILNEIR